MSAQQSPTNADAAERHIPKSRDQGERETVLDLAVPEYAPEDGAYPCQIQQLTTNADHRILDEVKARIKAAGLNYDSLEELEDFITELKDHRGRMVEVSTLTGDVLQLCCSPEARVRLLKLLISERAGVSLANQDIYHHSSEERLPMDTMLAGLPGKLVFCPPAHK